jgi:hypothetical protein
MAIAVSLSFITVLVMYITTTNMAAAYPVFTTVVSNNNSNGANSTVDNSTSSFAHNTQCRSNSCSPGQMCAQVC